MRRVTDSAANRRLLDLFRAIGILQVVLFHVVAGIVMLAPREDLPAFIDRIPTPMNFTWQAMGVDMIFLVSALLISLGLLEEHAKTGRIDFKAHFIRRLSRILPLYYIAIALYSLDRGTFTEIALSAVFMAFVFGDTNVVDVGWAIEALMFSYIALPFAVLALARSRRPLLWILTAFLVSLGPMCGLVAV